MSNKIPYIFYYYIHSKLYEKYGNKDISIKLAKEFLYEWRILKVIRPVIIKELELLGLAEKVNKKTIRLKVPEFNEDYVSKSYISIGIC